MTDWLLMDWNGEVTRVPGYTEKAYAAMGSGLMNANAPLVTKAVGLGEKAEQVLGLARSVREQASHVLAKLDPEHVIPPPDIKGGATVQPPGHVVWSLEGATQELEATSDLLRECMSRL